MVWWLVFYLTVAKMNINSMREEQRKMFNEAMEAPMQYPFMDCTIRCLLYTSEA